MARFYDSTAVNYDGAVDSVGKFNYIFKAFEQSEDDLIVSKLNTRLKEQCGAEFDLKFYAGAQLKEMPDEIIQSLANCYAQVFNESWGESWTTESAVAEVKNCINCEEGYMPLMSLLFREGEVVGFSWAFVLEKDSLENDSKPFSSSELQRHECIKVARYWLDAVAKKQKLISIRELGVLKEYRHDKTPYLCLPIFEKAKSLKCTVAFLRTKVTSKAFKWSLGIGLVPIQLFMVDDLLLMHGSIRYATEIFNGLIDRVTKKKSQYKVICNIKRYLCQY
ncbi:MAG: hypothetical protein CMP91_01385 [Gammaproteobacteria bacterium]|nr:hypothetical protein [Gammaproteobacteria bacterium]MAY02817.1 hypothetical protein [Gammaproteobacteria bacterium]|tara:strand:+ start:709 stop:1542 length:834 start_codon:yes stop_codon:yes gene_type:complete